MLKLNTVYRRFSRAIRGLTMNDVHRLLTQQTHPPPRIPPLPAHSRRLLTRLPRPATQPPGARTEDVQTSKKVPRHGDGILYEHLADRTAIGLDFMADTGDGGDSTYAVARCLAQREIRVSDPRGLLEASDLVPVGAQAGRRPAHWGSDEEGLMYESMTSLSGDSSAGEADIAAGGAGGGGERSALSGADGDGGRDAGPWSGRPRRRGFSAKALQSLVSEQASAFGKFPAQGDFQKG